MMMVLSDACVVVVKSKSDADADESPLEMGVACAVEANRRAVAGMNKAKTVGRLSEAMSMLR